MLYHNENDADGIQQVLTALHQCVPYYGDDVNRVYSSQGVVADQLSVERGVNALFELSNGFTPEEQLEGLNLEIADWHAGNKFLKVCNNFLDSSTQLKSTSSLCYIYSVQIHNFVTNGYSGYKAHAFFYFFHSHMQDFFLFPSLVYNSDVNF